MGHLLDESGHQKLLHLLADGPALLLVESVQALLHRSRAGPDVQGVLGDLLDTPGMSEGLHTNTSAFTRR